MNSNIEFQKKKCLGDTSDKSLPSTSTAAATDRADGPDPWAAFKRKSTGASVKPLSKKPCKEAKESPNPHICLVCGSELSRGRDFNKRRHWIQKHPDQPAEQYLSNIVAKDHELAQKFLQRSKKTTKPPKPQKSLEVPSGKVTPGPAAERPPPHPAVQSSLSGYVTSESNLQTESRIQNMQNDLSRVILMLESLTVPETKKSPADVIVNKDIAGVLSSTRLLDVKHPDIIVDILEDGSQITCYTCQQFHLSQPKNNV